MNRILFLIVIFLLTVSCSKVSNRFTLDISLNKKDTDSAYIYIYEQEYGALRLYDKNSVKNGRIYFAGETSEPRIAFLKFSNDSVPYYFILNNNHITFSFDDNKFILKGGNDNTQYFRYLLTRQNIENAKKYVWNKYKKYASDSILTDSIENALKIYNDKLSDSLENITIDCINTQNLVSEIVWRRFGNSLPDSKLDRLKK